MSWFFLFVAGLLEVGWAVGLKYTNGFTVFWPTVVTVVSLVASIFLLGMALKALPMATAYAIWVGIGMVGTALLCMYLFGEAMTPLKVISLSLICLGIAGLKLANV